MHRIHIASPCHESWEQMSGGDHVRFCERCQHKVYNLSELTDTQVTELMETAEGRLCVRFYQRADGTVLTKDCPVGAGAKRRSLQKRLAFTTAGVAAAVASAATLLRPEAPHAESEPIMGKRVALPMIGEATPAPHLTMGAIAPKPEPGMMQGEVAVRVGRVAAPRRTIE